MLINALSQLLWPQLSPHFVHYLYESTPRISDLLLPIFSVNLSILCLTCVSDFPLIWLMCSTRNNPYEVVTNGIITETFEGLFLMVCLSESQSGKSAVASII